MVLKVENMEKQLETVERELRAELSVVLVGENMKELETVERELKAELSVVLKGENMEELVEGIEKKLKDSRIYLERGRRN